jgi:hypothetical protein
MSRYFSDFGSGNEAASGYFGSPPNSIVFNKTVRVPSLYNDTSQLDDMEIAPVSQRTPRDIDLETGRPREPDHI